MKKLSLLFLILFLGACTPLHQVRYTPSQWVRDNDRIPIAKPATSDQYLFADILDYQFLYQLQRLVNVALWFESGFAAMGLSTRQEALNTNNFDKVPDSTWFTNRLGRRSLSVEEVVRGANRGSGPDPKGPWTVLGGKTVGLAPGLLIKDPKGDRYLLKFDPPGHMFLATAAEIISTKIFYALGFNVPENYLVDFKPKILNLSPKATTKDKKGNIVPFNQKSLKALFNRIPSLKEGVYHALASKFIDGEPIGPFSMDGRRRGDKNDRIPHQLRRELRGYRVFSSLVAHHDSRGGNSLDTFIKTGPETKGYIQHYLIDFGSTLGSMANRPKGKKHLGGYILDYGDVAGSLFSMGAYRPNWDEAADPRLLEVGVFQAKSFRPEKWRPAYPNPAFQQMTKRDAFWATQILMNLSDEHIAAIVKEGGYDNPHVEKYMTRTLIARRNKIGEVWFSKMNPIGNFKITFQNGGTQITFEDFKIRFGLNRESSAAYRYRLRFSKGQWDLVPWTSISERTIILGPEVQSRMKEKPYYVQIQTKRNDEKFFGPSVDLIIQKKADGVEWLGLLRRYNH